MRLHDPIGPHPVPIVRPLAEPRRLVRAGDGAAARGGAKLCVILLSLLFVLAAGAPAEGASLRVAGNGFDSATCGAKASPCRSISRAIANAVPGDSIVVGPGRYGDLDGDGALGGPGEETGGACTCLIEVTKPLRIVSRDGFGATLIELGTAVSDGVTLAAAGASFGEAKRGFTVEGRDVGPAIQTAVGADGARIGGNLVLSGSEGVLLLATGGLVERNVIVGSEVAIRAIGVGQTILDNVALSAGTNGAIRLGGGSQATGNVVVAALDEAFGASGTGNLLAGNAALASDIGFELRSGDRARGNLAHGNRVGAALDGDAIEFSGNALIGNASVGLEVEDANGIAARGNSLFGNGSTPDSNVPETNCGAYVSNSTGVDLSASYWGSPAGPGFEPADQVCVDVGLLELPTVEPFATREIVVRPKRAR